MYLMNFEAMDKVERQAIKIEQLSKISLVLEEVMSHPAINISNYVLVMTNLTEQLECVYEALYEVVRHRANIPDAPPAATSEAEKHGKEGVL